jgi:uncharacterized membrane protein YkoI
MGIKDVMFWATEAKRKLLARRVDSLNLALLPYQPAKTIRAEVDALSAQQAELDMDQGTLDNIAQTERENEAKKKLIAEKRAAAKARRREAGAQPKKPKKKPAGPPATARRIK